ncbi:DUF4198 domain-containing protein [Vannielia litorea]|uniref:DUF4198 domain-containing protein n=1 Tax=Vannielia litorea TaxID=1217970 RepID=UPI0021BDE57F|nr:DUF4198 domain-containing protein [Vannielia litorea]
MFMRLASLAMCLSAALPAAAHEFWISPDAYAVPVGGTLSAEFRVGQEFKGAGYVFVPGRSERFEVVTPEGVVEVTPRVGDRPALNIPAPAEGLNVVVHQTGELSLTYKDMAQFRRFIEHKDWAALETVHRERGLPEERFKEAYRRYAKSLIAVGNADGADRAMGLEIEIVAVKNPYVDDLSGGMVVDVIYDGAARADAQVEILDKAPDGTVEVSQIRTDATGRAVFPVTPGHEYLVDSVVVRAEPNEDAEAGPVWRSLWASLTFRVPE